jgi:hypothetical protein
MARFPLGGYAPPYGAGGKPVSVDVKPTGWLYPITGQAAIRALRGDVGHWVQGGYARYEAGTVGDRDPLVQSWR